MTLLDWLGAASIIIGGFIGLAGWLSGHDTKTSVRGEWHGTVNTKLDAIGKAVLSVSTDIKSVQATLDEHGIILATHGTTLANHETRLVSAEQRLNARKTLKAQESKVE